MNMNQLGLSYIADGRKTNHLRKLSMSSKAKLISSL